MAINGHGFSNNVSQIQIRIGVNICPVIQATENQIRCVIPAQRNGSAAALIYIASHQVSFPSSNRAAPLPVRRLNPARRGRNRGGFMGSCLNFPQAHIRPTPPTTGTARSEGDRVRSSGRVPFLVRAASRVCSCSSGTCRSAPPPGSVG